MPLLTHSPPHPLSFLPLFPQSPFPLDSPGVLFFHGTLSARGLFSTSGRLPGALPITDQELLQALTGSSVGANGEARTHLPSVRSYETDLASLTLIGSVDVDLALIAAAADGGEAAEEHLAAGTSTMVVETVFPSGADEHGTISTRLFLPAKMVKEKATKMRSSLAANILSSNYTFSNNILAMTFRQVVLQHLWSFQLSLFSPGTERKMEDLGNPREVQADFIVSSSEELFISSLAEVVSSHALESAKQVYAQDGCGLPSNSFFQWFQKLKKTSSINGSISLSKISEREIASYAKQHIRKFELVKERSFNGVNKVKYNWWLHPYLSKLDKIGGAGFGSWIAEFIPTYRLEIDTSTFGDVKLEGCHKVSSHRWEALLTHYQLVELANILDIYYEDRYTLPNKRLLSESAKNVPIILNSKKSLWKPLVVVFAGGCALAIFSILAQHFRHKVVRKSLQVNNILSSPEVDCFHLDSLEASELEALCIAIIKRVKDELGWPGDVMVDKDIGVWTGELPICLRNRVLMMDSFSSEIPSKSFDVNLQSHSKFSNVALLASNDQELQTMAQEIASYQAVMTRDGKIVGFQPTSRLAVNHWSSNPLAKALFGGQKLSPGLLEPRLKIPRPPDAIPIELLLSVKPESRFALARPDGVNLKIKV
ncbi:hypothetical protein AXF42_Ash001198 [Apostasia shenzhenica]|uniref:Uncharacterized protein n=1 Tax=Apostasia shenzhenica TaxID=1088818 RepID=A0A2I0AU84_9ASPA|nr:hypothetical protein AXF42_Ash001198 [Apostasia shenzhenica]